MDKSDTDISAEWLSREDESCHPERAERLRWLAAQQPPANYWLFRGGLMSKFLFEETRYCFVYGQYLAVVVLGVAFIERALGAEFFASGRNDLERSGIAKLLSEARKIGYLTDAEYDAFDRARRIRNPVVHFRRPGDKQGIEYRMVEENEYPYVLIEQDARTIAGAVMHMLGRHAI